MPAGTACLLRPHHPRPPRAAPAQQVWRFMRERKDKDAANAFHVYESVARSIEASERAGQ